MHKLLIPLLLVALPVVAEPVYSYKDSSGNTVYTSERPPANVKSEEVRLPKLQTVPSQNNSSNNQNQARFTEEERPNINRVVIEGIPDEEALRANNGTFTVTVALQTEARVLPTSYRYQLLLDGTPYGAPQSSNSFTLTNVDRGQHTLQAQIVNNGMVVASSESYTFTVQRVARGN